MVFPRIFNGSAVEMAAKVGFFIVGFAIGMVALAERRARGCAK